MKLFDILQKKKMPKGVTETFFECQREGLTIRGTEYRPKGENLPVAIVSHGFMAFQDTVRDYAKFFAELGFISYCFDFCGGSVAFGKSDGKTTDMSVRTEMRDLEAVIEYVQSLPYTGDKLVLAGCSQGGLVSALVAARLKEKVDGIVLFYPAFCIPHDARAGQMMYAKFDPKDPPELILCGPMKLGRCYPMDVMDMDPFAESRGYEGPVLILHGTKDAIVDISYAKEALESYRMREGSGGVWLEIIEDAGHGFKGKEDEQAKTAIRRFTALK